MKNIRHLMVASKGCPQPPIRQHNNKIYVTTTNITAWSPKLPYDRTRKPQLTFSPPLSLPLSPRLPSLSHCPPDSPPSIFLSSEKQFVLNKLPWLNKICALSLSPSLHTYIWMGGWVTWGGGWHGEGYTYF